MIYYGDVLSIEYSAATGYALASQGNATIKVSGDVTTANIYATANVKSYTVNWKTDDTGYTISVKRVSSALKGASSGVLSNGSTVYHGDVLSVSYQKQDYYTIQSKGAETITVSGNVNSSSIYATASLNPVSTQWVLASEKPAGAEVVNRKWSYVKTHYTTSTTSSTMSGWLLYNTTSAWSEYGAWSEWQDGVVTGNDSRQVETQKVVSGYEKKTQYFYSRYYGMKNGYYYASAYKSGVCEEYEDTGWLDYSLK
jgi:hypothetical protein